MNKKVIIIGSGIGGLVAGAALANKGVDIQVLESHNKFGGYCHNFKRKDFEFIAAIMKIGGDRFKTIIDNLLKSLGAPEISWLEFSETIAYKNGNYRLGSLEILDQLKQDYPQEQEGLSRFAAIIQKLYESIKVIDDSKQQGKNLSLADLDFIKKYRKSTLVEVIEECISSKDVQTILLGLVDGKPDSSIFSFVMTIMFAFKGTNMYLPLGGAQTLIDALVDVIQSHGGRVCPKKAVVEILTDEGEAVGVKCLDGSSVFSDDIIISSDLYSALQMLPGDLIPQGLLKKVEVDWQTSCSSFTVWLGLDKTLEELKIPALFTNFYFEGSYDLKKNMNQGTGLNLDHLPLFVNTISSRDAKLTPKEKSQLVIGATVPANFQGLWDSYGTPMYKYRKKKLAEELISRAESILGANIKDHILVQVEATPKTYFRYTQNRNGASEGFEVTPDYIESKYRVRSSSIIPNLYAASMWSDDGGGVVAVLGYSMKVVDSFLERYHLEPYAFFENNFKF